MKKKFLFLLLTSSILTAVPSMLSATFWNPDSRSSEKTESSDNRDSKDFDGENDDIEFQKTAISIWTGPGRYHGVWFNTEDDYSNWYGTYYGYPRSYYYGYPYGSSYSYRPRYYYGGRRWGGSWRGRGGWRRGGHGRSRGGRHGGRHAGRGGRGGRGGHGKRR